MRPVISEKGRKGRALSAKSRQCPAWTSQPSATARSRSSVNRRVLPTPASPARRTAERSVADAEMPSVEHSCSSSASRPTNSDVMWSILSGTTDIDISVDPVLLVGGRAGPVPLDTTAPLAVPDRLELVPRPLGAVVVLRLEEEEVVHHDHSFGWSRWLTCRDSLPEVGPDIGTVPYLGGRGTSDDGGDGSSYLRPGR